MDDRLLKVVSIVCDDLEDQELLAITLGLQLGTLNPHLLGYDKIESLLTGDSETTMHEETKAAFLAIAASRLGL